MMSLVCIAAINALTVLPLAVAAAIVSRRAQRPALTHLLWVLVLVKFVTPPLFHLPLELSLPSAIATSPELSPDFPTAVPAAAPTPEIIRDPLIDIRSESVDPGRQINHSPELATSPAVAAEFNPTRHAVAAEPGMLQRFLARSRNLAGSAAVLWRSRPELQFFLLGIWLTGTVAWLLRQIVRTIQFRRRVLRETVAPAELQEQTAELASRLGLRRFPTVLVVDAAISPMLWGCGRRARLLFPAELAERLDDEARGTLLAHELAHFNRGDHWVRLLELVTTALFWWHPVVWWARRRIEESEEECCDAWVVQKFRETPRRYAEALLDTIDFLCESRELLPPVASGLGQAPFLRRRLAKILEGRTSPVASRRVRGAVAAAAIVLLPMQPFVFATPDLQRTPTAILATPRNSGNELRELRGATPDSPGDAGEAAPPLRQGSKNPAAQPSAPASRSTKTRSRAARGEKVWATAVSPDGRYVVRTSTARRMTLTDLKTELESDLSNRQITGLAFSPAGDWFATTGQDGSLVAWDSARGVPVQTVLNHGGSLQTVAVSPLGTIIAAGGRDGSVLLIDAVSGEPVVDGPRFPASVNCVRFSPDGRQLAVTVGDWMSSGPREVVLLDVDTGRTRTTLRCSSAPGAVAFASNDELIIGLWNGETQLWNLARRTLVGTADADKNVVATAAFSPDNPSLREVVFVGEHAVQDPLRRNAGNLPAASLDPFQ